MKGFLHGHPIRICPSLPDSKLHISSSLSLSHLTQTLCSSCGRAQQVLGTASETDPKAGPTHSHPLCGVLPRLCSLRWVLRKGRWLPSQVLPWALAGNSTVVWVAHHPRSRRLRRQSSEFVHQWLAWTHSKRPRAGIRMEAQKEPAGACARSPPVAPPPWRQTVTSTVSVHRHLLRAGPAQASLVSPPNNLHKSVP